MPAVHYLLRGITHSRHDMPGCGTIAQAARNGQQLLSTQHPPNVTCRNCLRYAVWDPEGNRRRAAADVARWDDQARRRAIRQAARNRAASAVLRRHRRAFLAAYEAEAALLTLAGDRPTVHAIDWPT